MQITLENHNAPLRGDLVLYLVKRTDLTPIPSTVEALIRIDDDNLSLLKQGKEITLPNNVKYKIILSSITKPKGAVGGDPNYQLVKIIALLSGAYELAFLKERAIVKESTSFSQVFRKCGGTMAVISDIRIDKFTCLIGEYPSYSLMRALGRNAATIVWDLKNRVSFVRIMDLFDKEPKETMPVDLTYTIESGFIERHETPAYISNNTDGSLVTNKADKGRRTAFEMFANRQTLNNLSTYLIVRKIWTCPLAVHLNAGDIVSVVGKKYVIVTATHAIGKAESGNGSQLSRFWLAELSAIVDKQ